MTKANDSCVKIGSKLIDGVTAFSPPDSAPPDGSWIPGHVRIPGNTSVDSLAALAITALTVELDIELEYVYLLADKYILSKWQSLWSNCCSGRHYRQIEPLVSTQVKYTHRIRSKEVLINRLRLGACRLNAHLFKIGVHVDGSCEYCGAAETISHYLFECPDG